MGLTDVWLAASAAPVWQMRIRCSKAARWPRQAFTRYSTVVSQLTSAASLANQANTGAGPVSLKLAAS